MRYRSLTGISLLASMLFLFVAGCSGSKQVVSPYASVLGTWVYTVYDTPQGNVAGIITLTDEADTLTGTMTSDMTTGLTSLEELSLEANALSFRAVLDAQGQLFDTLVNTSIEGETMEGIISVLNAGDFPIKATRKPATAS